MKYCYSVFLRTVWKTLPEMLIYFQLKLAVGLEAVFQRNVKIFGTGGFKWPTHIWALEQSFRNVKPVHGSPTAPAFQGSFHILKTKNFIFYLRHKGGFLDALASLDFTLVSQ